MFEGSARKKVKNTVINLVASCNDLISQAVETTSLFEHKVLEKECNERVLESAKHIIEGAGQEANARFLILLQRPGMAFNPERAEMDTCMNAGTIYMMMCRALFDIYGDMKDFEELQYVFEFFVESKMSVIDPFSKPEPKKKNAFKLISAILTILLCVSCIYGYRTTGLLHEKEESYSLVVDSRDMYVDRCATLREYLNIYQVDFAYITKSGTKYHKINCPYIQDKDLYINTIPELERQGRKECSFCYKDSFSIYE